MEFVWFLIIGLIAGWLAGLIMKAGGYGVLADIVLGVLGSMLGGFLFGIFGVAVGAGLGGQLLVATVGAMALILATRVLRRV